MTKKEKLELFYKSVETAQQTLEFEELYRTIQLVFEVKKVHPSVKHYIESTINTKKIPGYFVLNGFAGCYKHSNSLDHFYRNDNVPKDMLLPAFYFAYESSGQEFYMFIESGRVLGPHHDSMWNEYFDSLYRRYGANPRKTLTIFERQYGVSTFTYIQFEKLQRVLREKYGVQRDRDFYTKIVKKEENTIQIEGGEQRIVPGHEDFLDALKEACRDDNGKQICEWKKVLKRNLLESLVNWFDGAI